MKSMSIAAQVLTTLKIWESSELSKQFGYDKPLGAIDRNKLNIKGSSLALRIFCSNRRTIIATMAKTAE